MNAAGVAGGAAAEHAANLARNRATTFGRELAEALSDGASNPIRPFQTMFRTLSSRGNAEGAGYIVGQALKTFKTTNPGHLYNWGGVALTGFGPLTTAQSPDNYFGWQSPASLRTHVPNLLTDASDQPSLGLPVMTSGDAPPPVPTMSAARAPVEPVMED